MSLRQGIGSHLPSDLCGSRNVQWGHLIVEHGLVCIGRWLSGFLLFMDLVCCHNVVPESLSPLIQKKRKKAAGLQEDAAEHGQAFSSRRQEVSWGLVVAALANTEYI